MYPFFSLNERMGAFVIGFGNLYADIKRAQQSRQYSTDQLTDIYLETHFNMNFQFWAAWGSQGYIEKKTTFSKRGGQADQNVNLCEVETV